MTTLVRCGKIARLFVGGNNRLLFPCYGRKFSSKQVGRNVLKLINEGLDQKDDMKFLPLHLEKCLFKQSFSSAVMKLDKFCVDENGIYQTLDYVGSTITPVVSFQSFFERGYSLLRRFVTEGVNEDDDEGTRLALLSLLQFLTRKDYHESCLKSQNTDRPYEKLKASEAYSAVLLTIHLLSQLVTGNDYIISSDYSFKPFFCPCSKDCGKRVNYGPTGLGFEELWYGHPDIVLLSSSSNVVFCERMPAEDSIELEVSEECTMIEEIEKSEIIEEKVNSRRHSDQEIVSQTITSSIYQFNKSNLTLVPSLLLTPSSFSILCYDPVNDVLLRSRQTGSLWNTENAYEFNMSAILKIWMVVNHAIFKPSINENHLKLLRNSSNFHKLSAAEGLSMKYMSEKIQFKSHFKNTDYKWDSKRINNVELELQ